MQKRSNCFQLSLFIKLQPIIYAQAYSTLNFGLQCTCRRDNVVGIVATMCHDAIAYKQAEQIKKVSASMHAVAIPIYMFIEENF